MFIDICDKHVFMNIFKYYFWKVNVDSGLLKVTILFFPEYPLILSQQNFTYSSEYKLHFFLQFRTVKIEKKKKLKIENQKCV